MNCSKKSDGVNPKVRIVAVSDASLGYGSPQIPAFINSLVHHYAAEAIVIEPDTPNKPPRHDLYPELAIKRVYTDFHPYSISGRIQYITIAAKEIDKLCPDILVVFCTYSMPILFKINFRPRFVIYYSIEFIGEYGLFDIAMNRHIAPLVDLIIFPEENRAALDLERCALHRVPVVILYNCSNDVLQAYHTVDVRERNGRIISAGTIAAEWTFAEYYLHEKVQFLPIDLYGPIEGLKQRELTEAFHKLNGFTRYCGYIDIQSLASVRKHYCFSIVIWNPAVERGLYAPSNKFFEAIADGVPPITAPHPQHKTLIDRYKCGIVMEGWSFDAFYAAIRRGLKSYGTDLYDKMVENCRKAVAEELNWERQFAKVKPHLKELK